MKTTTITRYETSDGQSFDDPRLARRHEIECALREDESEKTRLTAGGIISRIADDPKGFAAFLVAVEENLPVDEGMEIPFKSVRTGLDRAEGRAQERGGGDEAA